MAVQFRDVFDRHVGAATARQFALADLLGERPWSVDIQAGKASFGELEFPVQLLGTEAEGDNTWLWAWANEASALPEAILSSARRLRALGADNELDLLTSRSFPLDEFSGHQLALACTGLLNSGPYYRGPYPGGALYFVLGNIALPAPHPERVSTVLMHVISTFKVDHRAATRGLFTDLGLPFQEAPNAIQAACANGATVHVDFDPLGRVSKLQVSTGIS